MDEKTNIPTDKEDLDKFLDSSVRAYQKWVDDARRPVPEGKPINIEEPIEIKGSYSPMGFLIDRAIEGAKKIKDTGFLGPPDEKEDVASTQPTPSSEAASGADDVLNVPPVEIRGNPEEAETPGGLGGYSSVNVSSQGNPFEKQLAQDYDEQIAALEGEGEARKAYAQDQSKGIGNYADLERQKAQESGEQAAGTYQKALSHLEELGQLSYDYANQKIDPDKFWQEKSVPQKIATVIGAMLAGLQGGPKGAMDYIDNLVNRSIAVQQANIAQKGKGLYYANNLFYNFLKASGDYQVAADKTRAALLDAAMHDVAASGANLKGDIEQQQIKELIAALKAQRDTVLAKLQASAAVGAGRGVGGVVPGQWLKTEGENIVTDFDGRTYYIPNKAVSEKVSDNLTQYRRIIDALQAGVALLRERENMSKLTHPVEYWNNLKRGDAIDGILKETFAKLSASRGIPQGVLTAIQETTPSFGSPFASINEAKVPQSIDTLRKFSESILRQANAQPVDYMTGSGTGKHAGEVTNYVRFKGGAPASAPSESQPTVMQKYPHFQPTK